MSDIVKWGLLVAGIIALIAMILTLPFVEFLDTTELGNTINGISAIAGQYLYFSRKLINNFFTPFGRHVLSGVLIYQITKWIITIGIKTTAWIYHFIFK